ncbi:predicted protein [Brucella melitensis bv. 3 str. Ether]|nr:predicted protein [Brucella melitensis bv. 3 str. Ether]
MHGHSGRFSPYRRCASYNAASAAKGGANPTGKLPASKFRRVEMAQSQIERNVNSCLATLNPHNPIR